MFVEEFDHSGSENRENQKEEKSWRKFCFQHFSSLQLILLVFIHSFFCNWQEKAPAGLPIECSREKSQDEDDEEDKQPSRGRADDQDDDDDGNTEEEKNEFDSGDEEILTKSGW